MSHKLLLTITISGILILGGCNQDKSLKSGAEHSHNTIQINGKLEGGEGKKVVLEEMGAREFIPEDTVSSDDEGRFSISLVKEKPAFYVLRCGPSGYITLLLEPGETVEYSGKFGDNDSYSLKGSPGSELLHDLSVEHKRALNALAEISRKNMDLISEPDYPSLKAGLDQQFDSITRSFYEYSLNFIHQNTSSLAILVALYNLYGQGLPVFQPDSDFSVYQFVDSALMSNFGEFEAVVLLHAQVEEAGQIMNDENRVRPLQTGEIAPDFVSSRPDGELISLSELKGNYVLLSFWAGWSRLSRDENHTLKEAFGTYKNHPFRILQVSLDDEKETWINAIREDGLEWIQLSDLRRWESVVVDLYRVEKIPSNVLIDPEGRIMETDLFGKELLDKLEVIFLK